MTVSLSLRAHPSIPERTRLHIEELAKAHGYRPDPALAALNAWRNRKATTSFQGTLAWVTGFATRNAWRQMIQTSGYWEGACARADELGYRIEDLWICEPGLSGKRASQILLARGVRGLIIAPLPNAHSRIELNWQHFSAVSLGYSLAEPQLHVVMNHQFRNMKQLVEQMYETGYRRIGLAMPAANDERVDHNYLAGFWIAQQTITARDAGFTQLPSLLVPSLGRDVFMEWFYRHKPDAIIVAASMVYEIRNWLKADGLAVPRNVGLAVAAVPWRDELVSGMNEDVPSIGARAVDTIVGMIHRNEQGIPPRPLSLLVEGIWQPGKTLRKVAAKKPTPRAKPSTPESTSRPKTPRAKQSTR